MKWGCFFFFAAWSWMEAKYKFASMVHLVLLLHHSFDRSKRTFITLLILAVKQSKCAFICPQTSLECAITLHVYPIWMWEAIKRVYSLNHDIMASFKLDSDPELPISDPTLSEKQSKGAFICPQTLLKGAQTHNIYSIWMYEAINSGLQHQPWHQSIIYTQHWPHHLHSTVTQNCQNLT
jgi:hypothetical protein